VDKWLKKAGAPSFQKLLKLGYNLPEEFAVFPPVVLDTFSAIWTLEGGNDLLAHYKDPYIKPPACF